MTTVLLYGHLREKFGHRHEFEIKSAAEAIQALKANFSDFERHIVKYNLPGYQVFVGDSSIPGEEFHCQTSKTIKIVPVVAGASSKDVFNIIIGTLLIVYGGPAAASAWGATAGQIVVSVGVALVLQGVGGLLYSPPKVPERDERPENQPSHVFGGAVNTTAQGNPVPICYGKLRVGSQVISVGLSTEQML